MANVEQNIHDNFQRFAKRDARPDEIERFRDTSDYHLKHYLMSLPEYNSSMEYGDRWAQIIEMHEKIFGYKPSGYEVDRYIRSEMSDSQILYLWRNSQFYQEMFRGKPTRMGETEYLKLQDELNLNREGVQRAFATYAGRGLSEDEIQKIFFGGPGSESIRREYARVKARQASDDAIRGNRLTTAVKIGPLGPVQQLMAGRELNAPARTDYSGASQTTTTTQTDQGTGREAWSGWDDLAQALRRTVDDFRNRRAYVPKP